VTVGHGDNPASTGAKNKPRPDVLRRTAQSHIGTKRSHRGIFSSPGHQIAAAQVVAQLP